MLLLEGYTKQVYIDHDSAARGGPGWAIRVTNDRGRQVTFLALSWRLRPSRVDLRGCGGLGDEMLAPRGPPFWLETTMAIDADVVAADTRGGVMQGDAACTTVHQPDAAPPGPDAVVSREVGGQLATGPEGARATEA